MKHAFKAFVMSVPPIALVFNLSARPRASRYDSRF